MWITDCWAYTPVISTVSAMENENANLEITDTLQDNRVSITLNDEQLAGLEAAIREYRERKNAPTVDAAGARA